MKKIYYLLLSLILPTLSFAQLSLDNIPLESEMEYIFYSDNSTEQKIKNIKTWVATTFGDYNSVLQFEDVATGRIIIKGKTALKENNSNIDIGLSSLGINFELYTSSQYSFTMIFDVKDEKFRIKIENVKYMVGSSFGEKAVRTLPNEERTLDERFSIIEKNENALILDSQKQMLKIQDKLNQGVRKKKDKEMLIAAYKEHENKIKELEANKDEEIKKGKEKLILEYKSTFFEILKSASEKISEKDDF